jgi:hypothetical protein
MEMAILTWLRRIRRPFAWAILLVGISGFLLTFPLGVLTSYDEQGFWVTLAGFLLLILDGYDKVTEVEFDDEGNLTEVDDR